MTIIGKMILQGIIIANNFNEHGDIIDYALLTDDEEKYLIIPGESGKNPIIGDYEKKKVYLEGELRIFNDRKTIRAEKIISFT